MLKPGEKVSHYRIVSVLGTGGMGEVYLARDTKLERGVAIKFLHSEFTKHEDALDRFVREAKAASALNHPNIITVYEIGEWQGAQFIAMEFVEGHSLRDLLRQRRLTLDDLLDLLIQTGTALADAHAAGIVHRDVKPENIVRRTDGLVKVLDFGLAKRLTVSQERQADDSEASTRGLADTAPGFALGTTAYMSPEQARGKPVDARTDIWSLGVVIYEIVAGHLPFPGDTRSDMLAAILKSEPEPLAIGTSDVGRGFQNVIRKALGKRREERYQDIKDLILDLRLMQGELKTSEYGDIPVAALLSSQAAMSTRSGPIYSTTNHRVRKSYFAILGPAAAAVMLFGGWYMWPWTGDAEVALPQSLTSTQITSWKSELGEEGASRPRLSPDGRLVAYVAPRSGKGAIWLKQIDGGDPFTRKQDDSIDSSPLWSPKNSQIAFYSERAGRRGIWAAPALGGTSMLLAPLDGRARLVHWSRDGSRIFFKMGPNLYTLSIADRQVERLTGFDESQVFDHGFSVSPDEKQIAYIDRQNDRNDIWISGLRGENPVRLTDDAPDDTTPLWHPDGKRIIYNCDRSGVTQICVVFIDSKRQAQLSLSDTDSRISDISSDGTKILYTTTKDDADLWAVSLESGKEQQITKAIGVEFWPDVSPNGQAIVYQSDNRLSTGGKLLQSALSKQELNVEGRVSQLAQDGFNPRWSPDGSRVAFLRSQAGNHSLWISSADGADQRRISEGGVMFGGYSTLPYNRVQSQDYQWSSDSRTLVYSANRGGVWNIWQAAADGSGEKPITTNEERKLIFFNPIFSPDGTRIAWTAMTTGTPDQRSWAVWLHAEGAARSLYQRDSILRLVGWSASGQQLILKSASGKSDTGLPDDFEVFELDARDGAYRPLAALKAAFFQNVALSPDAALLAFVSRTSTGDAIQTLTLSRPGTPKTVAASNDDRVYFSNLTFAPDGKTLFFGKQSNSQVISIVENFK